MRVISDQQRRVRLGVRHALAAPAADTEAATRAVTCLHATEPASVYLSAHARCRATREQIENALYEERTIVRQLAMRRTVFAFPRDLLPAVWASAAARVAEQQATRVAKDIELAGAARDGRRWLDTVCGDILDQLKDGPATTAQLRERVPELGRRIPAPQQRDHQEIPIAPRVLTVLAATGAVIRGRNDGGWKTSRPFWTTREQWVGDIDTVDRSSGYAELVRRWLWSFGPGTEADLVWWLGATKAEARRALVDVGAVEVLLADGTPAWLHPDDTDEVAPPRPWAALLPSLDPSTMGWKERGFYLGEHAEHIFDRNGNGGPTAWWNGRVVGGWTQDDDGTVVVCPVTSLPKQAESALARKARELTTWLAGDVVRSIYQSPLVRARVR